MPLAGDGGIRHRQGARRELANYGATAEIGRLADDDDEIGDAASGLGHIATDSDVSQCHVPGVEDAAAEPLGAASRVAADRDVGQGHGASTVADAAAGRVAADGDVGESRGASTVADAAASSPHPTEWERVPNRHIGDGHSGRGKDVEYPVAPPVPINNSRASVGALDGQVLGGCRGHRLRWHPLRQICSA